MVHLYARQPVNVKRLDFSRLLDGENAYANNRTIRLDYKDTKERERFEGNFTANALSRSISGSAATWKLTNYKTGKLKFVFTEMDLSAAAVLAAAKTKSLKDDHALIHKLLSGNDSLTGSPFDDVLYGYGGDDTLRGGAGKDRLDGGDGNHDRVSYENGSTPVQVALDGGDWTGVTQDGIATDRIRNVEGVIGGRAGDTLTGDKKPNRLIGNDGDDTLTGAAGRDSLQGGDGNDSLVGGRGDDDIQGDVGADVLSGGRGNDDLNGGKGNDILIGAKGDDTLIGGRGSDFMDGGKGSDSIKGGNGDDIIVGGAGTDLVNGGKGADTFRFLAVTESTNKHPDVVSGFKHKLDKIDLSAIDAITSVADGVDDAFIRDARGNAGSAVAEGHIGWYRVDRPGTADDHTYIRINNDADAAIDMTIELEGALRLGAIDFIL